MENTLKQHITRYIISLRTPFISTPECVIIIGELTKLVMAVLDNPAITHDELWEKIHEDNSES